MKKYIWIDSDFGISDVFALIGAVNLKDVEIVGVSTCFGECNVDEGYNRAINLFGLLNKKFDIYKGCCKGKSKAYSVCQLRSINTCKGFKISKRKWI